MINTATLKKSGLCLAVVVPEVRVANVSFNYVQIRQALTSLRDPNPDWVILPRLCLTAASCGDLFRQPVLQEAALQALQDLAPLTGAMKSKVLLGLPLAVEGVVVEAVAVLSAGKIHSLMAAPIPDSGSLNPSSSLSGRAEFFVSGRLIPLRINQPFLFGSAEIVLGVMPPSAPDAKLLINLINLPAQAPAKVERRTGFDPAARAGITAICSVGASESTTDQVFAGTAEIWHNGVRLATAPEFSFETQCIVAECPQDQTAPWRNPEQPFISTAPVRFPFIRATRPEEQFFRLLEIQSTGLMKRLLHTRQCKVVLGLSGGADSSQALLVCCRAFDRLGLGREGILAVWMPGPGSSLSSRQRNASLADLAGVSQRTISIEAAVNSHLQDISHPAGLHDVTYENSQARERTQILMDLANQQNALVVGTGDLSEIALGWCTFNGDHMSMYNVNCGLPKTLLLRLLVWSGKFLLGQAGEDIASQIAQSPVSPELLPLDPSGETSQKTEEVLGPYELHDFFLYYAIGKQMPPQEVFSHALRLFGQDYTPNEILLTLKTFYRRFLSQQFKRNASPDGPQLLEISLSPRTGWRMPSDACGMLWQDAVESIELPGNL